MVPHPVFDNSFLPTPGRQNRQKLDTYAQLYVTYTNLIQEQGDVMRHDMQRMERAYNEGAAEFVSEQKSFARNEMGNSFVLADLNEYAKRCDKNPQTFRE
jgi:hypothetical protein